MIYPCVHLDKDNLTAPTRLAALSSLIPQVGSLSPFPFMPYSDDRSRSSGTERSPRSLTKRVGNDLLSLSGFTTEEFEPEPRDKVKGPPIIQVKTNPDRDGHACSWRDPHGELTG